MPRRLGQHFLKDQTKLRSIVAALNIAAGDFIIEIGPGHGELTDLILKSPSSFFLLLVEKDRRLALLLKRRYAADPRVLVIAADVRDFFSPDLSHASLPFGLTYKLIGNIPYYLTGRLLRLLSDYPPVLSVLTVQKEVGERLCPPPGRYNLLAASVAWWGQARIILHLPRRDFSPPPRVDSVVIVITAKSIPLLSPAAYFQTIQAVFKQPRKLLLNNLAAGFSFSKPFLLSLLVKLNLPLAARPGDLNFDLLVRLTRLLNKL